MSNHRDDQEKSFYLQWINFNGVNCFDEAKEFLMNSHVHACKVSNGVGLIVGITKEGKKTIRFTVIEDNESQAYKMTWANLTQEIHSVMGDTTWAASNDLELCLGAITAYWNEYTDHIYNTHKIVIEPPYSKIGKIMMPNNKPIEFPDLNKEPVDKYATLGDPPLDSQEGPCLHGISLDVPCPIIITRPSDLDLNEQSL